MKWTLKKAHRWVMRLVAAEINTTKQNSNASIVQEMLALGVISIWSEHLEK